MLVLGLTFKENCPDVRNTKVVDLVGELRNYHCRVDVFDPWVNKDEAEEEYAIRPIDEPEAGVYDAAVLAVAHDDFAQLGIAGVRALCRPEHVVYDIKNLLGPSVDGRL